MALGKLNNNFILQTYVSPVGIFQVSQGRLATSVFFTSRRSFIAKRLGVFSLQYDCQKHMLGGVSVNISNRELSRFKPQLTTLPSTM